MGAKTFKNTKGKHMLSTREDNTKHKFCVIAIVPGRGAVAVADIYQQRVPLRGKDHTATRGNAVLLVEAGDIASEYDITPKELLMKYKKLLKACISFINADRSEHLTARLNDDETAAVNAIKREISNKLEQKRKYK